ncbi:MAG: hypothetical protein ABIJ15_09460, partial [bacterium]
MYYLTDDNRFVIEDYNRESSFSGFFPGIAGRRGIPMWLYYVSRAQCLCSAGVRDKNNQLMEFLSFNRALQLVGSQGFRTFIKIAGPAVYEPFRKTADRNISQKMLVSSYELEITETNKKLGFEISVVYFPVVNTPYPALVREVRVKNLTGKQLKFDIIDGLPRALPYGIDLEILHTTQRHIEGMIGVFYAGGLPLFRLKQSPADVEKVSKIAGGNFYFSFNSKNRKPAHNRYIVDPEVVFGENEIYDCPWNFLNRSVREILKIPQIKQNKTSSALTAESVTLTGKDTYTLYTVIGQTASDNKLPQIARSASSAGWMEKKRAENRKEIESIKDLCMTASADRKFDEYCRQTFLDNVIRGGMPVVFSTAEGKSAFYIYSRQNGDLERDYHFFVLEPTYYSQGTGHYRSVLQNRRCDSWFFPETLDKNIMTFMNLIQTDGYNPLEVTQVTYSATEKEISGYLSKNIYPALARKSRVKNKNLTAELRALLSKSFSPGELLLKLENAGMNSEKSEKALRDILSFCTENDCGNIHEGFWIDHWSYNFDLIDNFLMLYPDKLEELLVGNNGYYFYDDPDVVKPRSEKFILSDGKVLQYNAVERNSRKTGIINSRGRNPKRVRTKYGEGDIYHTNLLVKILCLIANRVATLDPDGIGIEMEANKPGWNDSMNGLPGIMGSSLCQTLELEKALEFLSGALGKISAEKNIKIYDELYEFMTELKPEVLKRLRGKTTAFEYWDESHTLKEKYRQKTIFGISGKEKNVTVKEIRKFADIHLELVSGISRRTKSRIFNKSGIPYTYFENRVTKYEGISVGKKSNKQRTPLVKPLKFSQKKLPLFLEGPVHMMKAHPESSKKIYEAVRKSGLFDRKLKMYKVCESLEKAPFEIGRVKAWGAGWIENESVYTHMEYKYLLEVLKSGLYEEFFRDIKTMLPPFFKPEIYGRSIFENASFIVSSAFPDGKMHGRGIQPRLSGVTSEMVNIWILMVAGKEPFFLDRKNELCFRLSPILPEWLFTGKPSTLNGLKIDRNCFAFNLFGGITVIYKNNKRKNTYGKNGVNVKRYALYYGRKKVIVNSPVIGAKYA